MSWLLDWLLLNLAFMVFIDLIRIGEWWSYAIFFIINWIFIGWFKERFIHISDIQRMVKETIAKQKAEKKDDQSK